jgi:predicted DNA-binding ribbon-helix-helix protein
MKSPVVKRSVVISGHKTSISLEDAFWKALKEIATGRTMTLSDLVGSINVERQHANLSSAIRLFVLNYYRIRINEEAGARNTSPAVRTARPAKSA